MSDSDPKGAWIQTFTGGKFHLLDPREDEINIEDIAHSLAMQCRFTGHTQTFYSVAEHCVLGSLLLTGPTAFEFLMHDASEAYLTDISRPLKHFTDIGPPYLRIEADITRAIKKKFGLPENESPVVKQMDNAMLFAEKDQLLEPVDWDGICGDIKPADIEVKCWTPVQAKLRFLHKFYELTEGR